MKNRFTKLALTVTAALTLIPLAPAQSKDDLTKLVRHQLVMLPYLSVFDNLSFRVDNGTVQLFGEVTRPALKSDAEGVVKRIEGVAKVENRIEVLPLSPFDDRIRLATARAIFGYAALQRYGMGALPSIRIIVKNGNVTLEGAVGSEMDRNLAFIRANGVAGAFSVKNGLIVDRS